MRNDQIRILDSKTLNQIDEFEFDGGLFGSGILQVDDWSIAISGENHSGPAG